MLIRSVHFNLYEMKNAFLQRTKFFKEDSYIDIDFTPKNAFSEELNLIHNFFPNNSFSFVTSTFFFAFVSWHKVEFVVSILFSALQKQYYTAYTPGTTSAAIASFSIIINECQIQRTNGFPVNISGHLRRRRFCWEEENSKNRRNFQYFL